MMNSRIVTLSLMVICALIGTGSPLYAETMAAGASHSVVVKPDGTVWGFGDNGYGQLGDGTTTDRPTPVPVTTIANIIAVAAGSDFTLALESNGTVWAWGRNASGQLGDNTITNRPAPIIVADLPPCARILQDGDQW